MNLVEIFWSVQGEGLCVGEPSVFVRLGECDLRCAWCDSPGTWQPAVRGRIEASPGSERFEQVDNPTPLSRVLDAVRTLDPEANSLVSVTGGEPLLQPAVVKALASAVRSEGRRVLLETHGLAVAAIRTVAREIDVVSMDWKLASDVRRASDKRHETASPFHDAHEAFLEAALEAESVYVKVVVTKRTRDDELDEVCRRIARLDNKIPLVLQPVTPCGSVRETPSAGELLAWLRRCHQTLADVRLIPQTHKTLGAL